MEIFRIRGFNCDFFAAYGFESDGAGVESEAIKVKETWFVGCVEFVTNKRVVKRLEMYSNLVSPARLRFGFDKSNASIFRSFQHLEIRNGFTFFPPARNALACEAGGSRLPFSKIASAPTCLSAN